MVSRPTYSGGLGFGYKWNLGWMHDTLRYFSNDPVHRRYHHDDLTFGLLYTFHENFILALSHDEVVHGKRSLIGRMPGDRWQRFANLRAYYGFMFTYPGKKLLFMGNEIAQEREWDHDGSVDWHLLDDDMHRGIRAVVTDLNRLYRAEPALHGRDCDSSGFEWIDCHDHENSVISYLRHGPGSSGALLVVLNLTPVVRRRYRTGVPWACDYIEIFNSDSRFYGGSDVGNGGAIEAEPVAAHGRDHSLSLTLPPLSAIVLKPSPAP
jgi:1,4-alpha-glucan branching enzyme